MADIRSPQDTYIIDIKEVLRENGYDFVQIISNTEYELICVIRSTLNDILHKAIIYDDKNSLIDVNRNKIKQKIRSYLHLYDTIHTNIPNIANLYAYIIHDQYLMFIYDYLDSNYVSLFNYVETLLRDGINISSEFYQLLFYQVTNMLISFHHLKIIYGQSFYHNIYLNQTDLTDSTIHVHFSEFNFLNYLISQTSIERSHVPIYNRYILKHTNSKFLSPEILIDHFHYNNKNDIYNLGLIYPELFSALKCHVYYPSLHSCPSKLFTNHIDSHKSMHISNSLLTIISECLNNNVKKRLDLLNLISFLSKQFDRDNYKTYYTDIFASNISYYSYISQSLLSKEIYNPLCFHRQKRKFLGIRLKDNWMSFLRKINSTLVLRPPSIESFFSKIRNFHRLDSLILTSNYLYPHHADLLNKSSTFIQGLRFLNLSYNYLDLQSIWNLAQYLPNLIYLNISNNLLLDTNNVILKLPKLVYLNLHSNSLSADGFAFLSSSKSYLMNLRYLNLGYTGVTKDSVEHVNDVLRYTPSLNTLHLEGNSINNATIELLSLSAQFITDLEYLNLSYNQIEDDGCNHLSKWLKYTSHLKTIKFGYNKFTQEGLQIISDSFIHLPSLTTLSLFHCGITQESIQILCQSIARCCNLTKLDLSGNTIGNDGIQILSLALKELHQLDKLNISNNGIGDSGVRNICDITPFIPNLSILKLDNQKLTNECYEYVEKILDSLHNLSAFYLYGNDTHRGQSFESLKDKYPNVEILI